MLGSGAQTTIDTIYATTKKAVETATTEGIKDITKSNVCFMCKMFAHFAISDIRIYLSRKKL